MTMPRLDKTRITVSNLADFEEEGQYWLSHAPADRLNAVELQRRMIYGEYRTTSRLQRFLEVVELVRG